MGLFYESPGYDNVEYFNRGFSFISFSMNNFKKLNNDNI